MSTPRCLEVGVGLEGFDCSGLVVRAISDVLGTPTTQWPLGQRHVRDIWAMAQRFPDYAPQRELEALIGRLVVFSTVYRVDGILQRVPGHVGIVEHDDSAGTIYIHANQRCSRVERCTELKGREGILGYVAVLSAHDDSGKPLVSFRQLLDGYF